MSLLDFDAFGNLTPYEIIEVDWETFVATFVTAFSESSTRMPIFEQFRKYADELRDVVGARFVVWVDGSFATQKQNPRDIDFVVFVPGAVYNQYPNEMDSFRRVRFERTRRLDGYLIPVYEEGHPDSRLNQLNRMQWQYDFGRDRHRRNKGIIQLNF